MSLDRGLVVSVVRCRSYAPREMEAALAELLRPWGGMAGVLTPHQRVLLKPNLLAAASPESAVTTHPALVAAVAREVTRAGGRAFIGDSPASGSVTRLSAVTGMDEVCRQTGAALLAFGEHQTVDWHGHHRRQLPLASELSGIDAVINIAKLKTHTLTGLTAAVKNLYGLVVGKAKHRFHLAHPLPLDFAHLLLDISQATRPVLNVVDAVVTMEGPGPRNGRPRHVGLLLAGDNALAVDAVSAAILGFRPAQVATLAAAARRRLPGASLDDIKVAGPDLEQLIIRGFDRGPGTGGPLTILGRIPMSWAVNLAARRRPYPIPVASSCTVCGHCARDCPPQAIHISGGEIQVDYSRCIRCYCCMELCPFGALTPGRR